jgi:hypothetical protein
MENEQEAEWKLEIEEFAFAGCMHNHTGMGLFAPEE